MKIEQVGIQKRTKEILTNYDEAYPPRQTSLSKQHEMEVPHCVEDGAAQDTPLHGNRQRLIVRISD